MKQIYKAFILILSITSWMVSFSHGSDGMQALYLRCTHQQIDFNVLQAIIKTESNNNPLAISINTRHYVVTQPKTEAQAKKLIKDLMSKHINFDTGLGQINVRNMKRLGLTEDNIFDPCSNLKALEQVYLDCLAQSHAKNPKDQRNDALSCYNTGSTIRGFHNGYVKKVLQNLSQ